MNLNNCSLTAERLADIGALGDFYDTYHNCLVKNIDLRNQINKQHGEYTTVKLLSEWSKQSGLKMGKICEQLLNTYLYIFSDKDEEIRANRSGFDNFHLFYVKHTRDLTLSVQEVSFDEFLTEVQLAIVRVLLKNVRKEFKAYPYERMYNEVNSRIINVANQQHLKRIITKDNRIIATDSVLYIYSRLYNTYCFRNHHNIEPKKYIADLVDSRQIILPVHYCTDCNKYFIGKETLDLFEKFYGKLIVKKCMENSNAAFSSLGESKLHMLGYNVINGKLTQIERRKILANIIRTKQMNYYEICASIEQNIQWFESNPRFDHAIMKWKSDLKFLGNWIINNNS